MNKGGEAAWLVELELGTCFPKTVPILGSGKDGDFENLAWMMLN